MCRRLLLVAMVLVAVALPCAALARDYTEEEEQKIGQQGAAEIEKSYKLVTKPEQLKRLDAILKTIAPVTERPTVIYHAKILNTDDVNALSLPGGYIYVTKGLMDDVESDDELAGVLAHEVAHNAHKHALAELDKSAKMDQKLMLMILVLILAGRERVDPSHVILLGTVLKMNALQGYGLKAELEADHSAVEYLVKAKRYNPVGVLQFMETLQREEQRRPEVPFTIFSSHPPTPQRVDALRAQLTAHNIPIIRLPGKNTPVAVARAVTVNGKEIAEVVLKNRPLFQPASPWSGMTALQRAEDSAGRVNQLFRDYAEERHVRIRAQGDEEIVYYKDSPLLTVTPEDARFHNTTPVQLAQRAAKTLQGVIWEDFLRRSY